MLGMIANDRTFPGGFLLTGGFNPQGG